MASSLRELDAVTHLWLLASFSITTDIWSNYLNQTTPPSPPQHSHTQIHIHTHLMHTITVSLPPSLSHTHTPTNFEWFHVSRYSLNLTNQHHVQIVFNVSPPFSTVHPLDIFWVPLTLVLIVGIENKNKMKKQKKTKQTPVHMLHILLSIMLWKQQTF